MRICFFGNAGSVHTWHWAGYFAKLGHEVHLASTHPHPGSSPGITFHPLPPLTLSSLALRSVPLLRALEYTARARQAARQVAQEVQPEIVHGHYVSDYGHLAWLSGCRPLVLTAWGSDLNLLHTRAWSSRLLTQRALGAADAITVNSTELGNVATRLGASPDKVHLIQFGIDTDRFSPGLDPTPLQRQLNLPVGDRYLLSPRAMKPIYNLTTIVEAFARIVPDFPNTRLLLKQQAAEESYLHAVTGLVQALGLQERVHFLPDLQADQMPLLYNLAEVVISVATSEGMPSSVHEALACGCLVIASDIPSLRAWITDRENGYLVEPRSPEEIEGALRQALSLEGDPRQAWTQRNRALIVQRASQQANMAAVERLYQELIRQAHRNLPTQDQRPAQ